MKIVAWRFRPVNARGMPWVFSYYEPPVPEGSFICEPLCVSNDVEKMRAHNERMHRALEYMLRNGELQYDLESLARHALANEDYPLGPKNSARAKAEEPPMLMSMREACRMLGGLGMATLHKHIREGRLPKVAVGGRSFIKREDLVGFIGASPEVPVPKKRKAPAWAPKRA